MASRTISVEIVGDADSLTKAFNKVGDASKGLGSKLASFGKVAAVGFAAAGAGAVFAGKKMLDLAGDAEETDSKLNVVFGKQLPKLKKDLDAFSDATGASSFKLREQAADLGALLGPLTGSTSATSKMSEQFVKLATDLSSFNNVPVDDALLAIRSGLVGEAEPLRRFGVLLNEAAVSSEAHRLGLVKGKEALTEQQKVMARASLIMAQTTKAQGDATRTAGSYTNSVRALKNTVTDLATGLGASLIPAATAVASGLNDFINKVSAADGASAKFGVAIDALKGLALTAWEGIKSAFNAIDWGAVGAVIGDGLRRALAFLSQINYGAILSQVGAKVFDTIRSVFNAIDFNAVGQKVGGALVTALSKLTSFINRVNWNQVGQAIVAGMGIAIKGLASWLAGLNYPAILGALAKGIVAVLKGLANLLLGIATALGKAIIAGIVAGLEGIIPKVKAKLDGARDAVVQAAKNVYGNALGIGKQIVAGILAGIVGLPGQLADKLESYVTGAIAKVGGILHGSGDWMFTKHAVGKPLAEGIGLGFIEGMRKVNNQMTRELNAMGAQLAAIANRRAAEDRASAVRDAEAALVQARKKKEGVVAAEQALARAREDIVVAGLEKSIAREQAALDKRQALVQTKMDKLNAAIQKAQDKQATILDKARDKILRAFDAVRGNIKTPAEAALEALTNSRTQRDLQKALADALQSGDQEAILRAREDIQRDSLERQAQTERTALDNQTDALRESLSEKLEVWKGGTAAILKLLQGYGIDFQSVGALLGSAFRDSMIASIKGQMAPALAPVGGGGQRAMAAASSGSGTQTINLMLDGKTIASVVRNENTLYQSRGGTAFKAV
jgi:hypothetical protein